MTVKQRHLTYLLLFSLGLGLDQLSKRLFASSVTLNTGVSFSLFSHFPSWFVITALGIFLAAAAWLSFPTAQKKTVLLVCHALFFSGALSNWLDRIFYGGVRDMWSVPFIGVQNNLADWLIFGSVLIVGSDLLRRQPEKVRPSAQC